MLPKQKRLTVSEVEQIFAHGKTARTSLFLVRYIKTPSGIDKYAAIAPKKGFPKAVDRNTIRRRIYNTLRAYDMPLGISVVFIAQKAIGEASSLALTQELRKIQWENA